MLSSSFNSQPQSWINQECYQWSTLNQYLRNNIFKLPDQKVFNFHTVLTENINTVFVVIRNKQMSSIRHGTTKKLTIMAKKTPRYLSDIFSVKSEQLQSIVSLIANNQTVKLVNSETNGIRELPITRSLTANVI